ncbi:MAG: D-alanyl-D-alanine carboxypeptidase [Acetilactobacillus jinshanensis]
MDARTGQIVYQKNENQHRLVASTGKLMDLYLVGRKINNTPNAWNQRVKINNGLRRMSYDGNDGGYHFTGGHKYTVGNLMKAGIIASSNNAAIALGQWAGNSNHHFLYMENKQSRLWHLRAHFISASGLENGDLIPWGYGVRGYSNGAGNEVSAKDLAVISYHILKDYPQFLKYSKVGDMHEDGQNLYNYNEFLPHHDYTYLVHGLHVDGLKTGWTPAAGYCFVGTAKMPHRDRIITVVLNDNHQWHESNDLMRYAYKNSKLSSQKLNFCGDFSLPFIWKKIKITVAN